jgi:hypothetical protein
VPQGGVDDGGGRADARAEGPPTNTPLWVAYPWLLGDWHTLAHNDVTTAGSVPGFHAGVPGPGAGLDIGLLYMSAEEVFGELEALRATWGDAGAEGRLLDC